MESGNVVYHRDGALERLTHLLEGEGLSVMRSFDLRSTNTGTGPQCFCTTHRPGSCDCQLVVLMVYDQDSGPATLVYQGHNGQARLLLAGTSRRALEKRIKTALHPAGIILSAR